MTETVNESIRALAEKLKRGSSIYSPEVYETLVQTSSQKPIVVLDRVGVLTPMFGDGHLLEQAVPALQDLTKAGFQIVIWTGESRSRSQVTFDDIAAKAGQQVMDGMLTICQENWIPKKPDDYSYVVNHTQNRGALNDAEAGEIRAANMDNVVMRTKPHFLFFPAGTPLIDDTGDQYSCNLAGPLEQYPHIGPIGVPKTGLLPTTGKSILTRWPILKPDIAQATDTAPRANAFSSAFLRSHGLI